MEKELNAAKRFNRVSIVIILIMLVLMGAMTVNMQYLDQRYRQLESKYDRLYEKLYEGRDVSDGGF